MKPTHHSFRRLTTGLTSSLLVFAVTDPANAASPTNTKIGDKAGAAVTTGTGNTAIGSWALKVNKTGKDNTAVGRNALKSNAAGGFNTALGSAALTKSTGSSNVAVGFQALFFNKSGGFNVALGNGSLLQNTTGSNNIALGVDAGANLTTGNDNICIDHPGVAGDSGIIRLGTDGTHTQSYIAGKIHGDGSGLTGVTATTVSGTISGNQINPASITSTKLAPNLTLGGITTGNFNIPATTNSTTGVISQDDTALLHTYGTYNTFAGKYAGNFTMTGEGNTAIGEGALISNTTGSGNTASGKFALNGNTTGNNNSASGDSALTSNTTGDDNSAGGNRTLYSNTTGKYNTASGAYALYSNTTSYSNTACGYAALYDNTTGSSNTASGNVALRTNITGINNSGYGEAVLYANTSGSNNTGIGNWALATNKTGTGNTAIGYQADVSTVALNNATAIGRGAIVNASNKIRLGSTAVTVIEGQVAFTFTSDRTQKENFKPVDGAEVLRKLSAMEFTSWNYIGQDAKEFRHYGAMAQDFHAAFGRDAVGTIGSSTTVNSGDMDGIRIRAIKELVAKNAALETRLARLEATVPAELK